MAELEVPEVTLQPVGSAQRVEDGLWRLTWQLEMIGSDPLEVHEAWLPHGRFRAEPRRFEPPIRVEAGTPSELTFDVACAEPPGTEFENGFLLLRTSWREAPWRVFARLTVRIGDGGAPSPVTEEVTIQPIRFEG
jgi:hypothetical protein